jgi:hypothetical protein
MNLAEIVTPERRRCDLDLALARLRMEIDMLSLAPEVRVEPTTGVDGIVLLTPYVSVPIFLSTFLRPPEAVVGEGVRVLKMFCEPNPLERYRLYHDLSYPQLAKGLELSVTIVHAYCTNLNSPPIAKRRWIEKATGGDVPAGIEWPLPPREAHRPKGSRSRRKAE